MITSEEALALVDAFEQDTMRDGSLLERLRIALAYDTLVGYVLHIIATTCTYCGADITDKECHCWNDE